MRKITKAIIPVAGLGTRFLPIAKSIPKEMIPVVDKPVIHYIVEDLVKAGIEEIIFVTSGQKRALEDYFDTNFELEARLDKRGMTRELGEVRAQKNMAKFAFVRQSEPLGDGHAVLQALPFVDDNEGVVVIFGDSVSYGETNAVQEVLDTACLYNSSVVSLTEVPLEDISRYGIVYGEEKNHDTLQLEGWLEKPKHGETTSRLAWNGCAVMDWVALDTLKDYKKGKGELRIADVFTKMLLENLTVMGRVSGSKWFDCGNKREYVKAQVHFALQREDMRDEVLAYIKGLV